MEEFSIISINFEIFKANIQNSSLIIKQTNFFIDGAKFNTKYFFNLAGDNNYLNLNQTKFILQNWTFSVSYISTILEIKGIYFIISITNVSISGQSMVAFLRANISGIRLSVSCFSFTKNIYDDSQLFGSLFHIQVQEESNKGSRNYITEIMIEKV